MKYSEIINFTAPTNYKVNVSWLDIEEKMYSLIDKNFLVELNPDFQRGHVWNSQQQIKYIEFKLSGGSGSNELLFNCPGWMDSFKGPYQFVDGLQRYTAVLTFLKNKIPAYNTFYKDFDGHLPSHCEFIWGINNLDNREAVLKWYIELNNGGVVHTKKEIDRVKRLLKKELKQ